MFLNGDHICNISVFSRWIYRTA